MPKPSSGNTDWAADAITQPVPVGAGTVNVPNKEEPDVQFQSTGALNEVIFPANYLNFKLDQVTEWITYFEEETDKIENLETPDVIDSNWVKANADYLEKDLNGSAILDITAQPKLTDIFVSPTGGGGDIVWSALDPLPIETKYIRIRIYYQAFSTSATGFDFSLHVCDYTADPAFDVNRVIEDGDSVSSAGTVGVEGVVADLVVPVDLRRLRFWWNENVVGGTLFDASTEIVLLGYGV